MRFGMADSSKIKELKATVGSDPGAAEFVELAQMLSEDEKTRLEAREVCIRGLGSDPKNLKGRLLLARLYYQEKLYEFCVRELVELNRQSDLGSVSRLLDAFGGFAAVYRQGFENTESSDAGAGSNTEDDDVVAEIDLEADFVDVFDEIDESEQ